MQELRFVPDDSDSDNLVLRDRDGDATYVLPVTAELRAALTGTPEPGDSSTPETTGRAGDTPDAAAEAGDGATPSLSVSRIDAPAATPRSERVHLRPKDIQDRIRHGASTAEIIDETGMPDRRVEAFARPVLMERARLADLAHRARPVLSDGPSHATLWEVLATAFAGRGEDLRQAGWDAALNSSDEWIITVTWEKGNKKGAAEFTAEFRWTQPVGSAATVTPVNSVAIGLVDPRVSTAGRSDSPSAAETTPDTPVVQDSDITALDGRGRDDHGNSTAGSAGTGTDRAADAADDGSAEVSFLRQPDPDGSGHPAKRRRKAATPHWEDVLLGVRPKPGKKK
ncbi:septation protein SepH [Corynebacterium nuruki]|jgi:hypothetical protein|uniref:DUF3071 domain-containing protein n=1 Tax=Corynebacterium nuruki TaxID=1032851 RepID=A0A3D4T1N0_9CORY|nr:septation protein SepH [Corynebacterium nuruki]HCT15428.1 DUF3071 domain-containing protein [Corynebacterium nuruki]